MSYDDDNVYFDDDGDMGVSNRRCDECDADLGLERPADGVCSDCRDAGRGHVRGVEGRKLPAPLAGKPQGSPWSPKDKSRKPKEPLGVYETTLARIEGKVDYTTPLAQIIYYQLKLPNWGDRRPAGFRQKTAIEVGYGPDLENGVMEIHDFVDWQKAKLCSPVTFSYAVVGSSGPGTMTVGVFVPRDRLE